MRVEKTAAAMAITLALGLCAPSGWRELDSVEALETRFNADQGHVRIVLLLSPT